MTYLRTTQIEMKEMDVRPLFESLQTLTKPMFKQRSLQLQMMINLQTIVGDETLLLSLLTNLVENAARASEVGGTIEVKAYLDAFPIFEVTDYGSGMDHRELEKITEPFYRVDQSRSRAFGGVGLGLSLCKQVADLHQAQLIIKSKLETGTTVQLIFTSL